MSINYIDDNGVRQIFSDIKSNLDSINNTATSAYTTANSAYTKANTAYTTATSAYTRANSAYTTANNANNLAILAYAGAITPNTQTFNIEGSKTFNITDGYFRVNTKSAHSNISFVLSDYSALFNIRKARISSQYSRLNIGNNFIELTVFPIGGININTNGIWVNDGRGHTGYINVLNCI